MLGHRSEKDLLEHLERSCLCDSRLTIRSASMRSRQEAVSRVLLIDHRMIGYCKRATCARLYGKK